MKQEGKIDCPYCRRKVTFLVIQNQQGPSDEELDCIRQYNFTHSEERGFIDNLRNAPFLIRQFWREVVETNGLLLVRRWQFITYILFGIFYLLSPLDIIPEAVFGLIGFIDDIAMWVVLVVGIGSTFLGVLE